MGTHRCNRTLPGISGADLFEWPKRDLITSGSLLVCQTNSNPGKREKARRNWSSKSKGMNSICWWTVNIPIKLDHPFGFIYKNPIDLCLMSFPPPPFWDCSLWIRFVFSWMEKFLSLGISLYSLLGKLGNFFIGRSTFGPLEWVGCKEGVGCTERPCTPQNWNNCGC